MNKLVMGVLGTAILMGAIIVSSKQWKTIEHQTASIEQQQKEIGYLTENLDLQVNENLSLEEENFLLEEHSGVLRDSVMRMKKSMSGLRKQFTKQQRYIALIEQKLNQLNTQYQTAKNNLAAVVNKGVKKSGHMQSLMENQSRLLAQIEVLKRKKKNAEGKTVAVAVPVTSKAQGNKSSREVTPFKKSNLAFSLPGTQIKMIKIDLRKKRFSKSLKKVKKGTDWRYTIININMDHPRLTNLLDKSFKVKLIDQQTQSVLSYVESNPNFPNSTLDSKGIGFTFEGQPIELVYYNNDDKASENYELQFFHIDDSGNEHLIPGATYQIVKNGRVLKSN